MNTEQFIDEKQLERFSACLSELRGRIGVVLFTQNDDYGVSGNTLRAFRGFINPGETYHKWAKYQVNDITENQSSLPEDSPKSFREWRDRLFKSLKDFWVKEQKKPLIFPQNNKLVDLFIKWISEHNFQNNHFLDIVVKHANSPLDRKSLTRLNECYSGFMPIQNPSMGHIKDEKCYEFCQGLISEFAIIAGGTRLLFDFWAW